MEKRLSMNSQDGFTSDAPVVKLADMSPEMQREALELAKKAMAQCHIPKDIAVLIKREFDQKYGPTWHCIVGLSFGSLVTHGKLQQFPLTN